MTAVLILLLIAALGVTFATVVMYRRSCSEWHAAALFLADAHAASLRRPRPGGSVVNMHVAGPVDARAIARALTEASS